MQTGNSILQDTKSCIHLNEPMSAHPENFSFLYLSQVTGEEGGESFDRAGELGEKKKKTSHYRWLGSLSILLQMVWLTRNEAKGLCM